MTLIFANPMNALKPFINELILRDPFLDMAPASAQVGANRKTMNFDTEF